MLIGFPLALVSQISQASSSPDWMRQIHSLSPGLARFLVLIAPYCESLKQRPKQDLHAAGPSVDGVGRPEADQRGLLGARSRNPEIMTMVCPQEVTQRGPESGFRAPELDCLGSNPRSPTWFHHSLLTWVTNPSVLWLPPVIKEIIIDRQRKSMRLK